MKSHNPFAIVLLLSCALSCILVLALMLALHEPQHTPEWGLEYLWVVAPYFVAAIAGLFAWRSRFFSGWILASILLAPFANPPLHFLVWSVFRPSKPDPHDAAGWALFGYPVIFGSELVALFVAGVVVRALESVIQRLGLSELRRRKVTWVIRTVCFCLVLAGFLSVYLLAQ
jgi:hypothetical protein